MRRPTPCLPLSVCASSLLLALLLSRANACERSLISLAVVVTDLLFCLDSLYFMSHVSILCCAIALLIVPSQKGLAVLPFSSASFLLLVRISPSPPSSPFLFSCPLHFSLRLAFWPAGEFSLGSELTLLRALLAPPRVLGSGPASGRRRSAVLQHPRLHVGSSCCRSRLVRLSFNRRRRSRRVAAICVRGICAAAAARAAVECWAAAWGAGRGGGCATITITHSFRASRASRAYSAASRGAATAAATGSNAIAAVGSARQRRCTRAR